MTPSLLIHPIGSGKRTNGWDEGGGSRWVWFGTRSEVSGDGGPDPTRGGLRITPTDRPPHFGDSIFGDADAMRATEEINAMFRISTQQKCIVRWGPITSRSVALARGPGSGKQVGGSPHGGKTRPNTLVQKRGSMTSPEAKRLTARGAQVQARGPACGGANEMGEGMNGNEENISIIFRRTKKTMKKRLS